MDEMLLALDQGTTSSRAIVFNLQGNIKALSQQEFAQIYPQPGWVEHDPDLLWTSSLAVCQQALAAVDADQVLALGISNQRETCLLWDRRTGEVLHNAIVWQDRRTAGLCEQWRAAGYDEVLRQKTGLLLDPYFSFSKLVWLLTHVSGARQRAEGGELAFGTVDAYLLWRLSCGRLHATDASNASRTGLFNIHTQSWDEELLRLFNIPADLLPEVKDCAADFGETDPQWFGRAIPIRAVLGDQQAAAIGQACMAPGMSKATFGTGAFVLVNTGTTALQSQHRLLTTVASRYQGVSSYALEGSVFAAGAAVQWLRDGLGLIASASETEGLAAGLADNRGVYLVPAFTGLGAPYWDADARGALYGLGRDTGVAELVRAALESVAYQTYDLLHAMQQDGQAQVCLRIDGGMTSNVWWCQFLANILQIPVEVPTVTETSALGAALMAGLGVGVFASMTDLAQVCQWRQAYQPCLDRSSRDRLLSAWQDAVRRTRTY